MAKKKDEPKLAAETEVKPEVKPVRLDMTERGHRLLRLVAAYEDKSMAAYARETLEAILEQKAKDMGLKI